MDLDVHFNEWAFLAQADPEVFERRRCETINGFLSRSGSRRQHLEALQSRIDARRKLAATPEEAVVAISALMCESLAALGGEIVKLYIDLKEMEELTPHLPADAATAPRPATVQEAAAARKCPPLSLSSRSSSG